MRSLILTLLTLLLASPACARFEPVTCRNSFTPEQEITEGDKVALEVYKQMPVLPDSDPVSRYVQQLGARLVAAAPLPPGVDRQWPFNFHVVASSDINAFALPGGSVFVNLGTIQAADTEAQLAGVMAHEISHDILRHSTCNLARQQKKSIFYGLGAIGSAILLGDSSLGRVAQAGIGGVQNLDFLHMSRDDEKQADLLGTGIAYDAGYDPRGLPQFFEIIKSKVGAGGAQFLSDHPNPGNRTEYVDAEIATLPPRQNAIRNTREFTQMHALAAERKALTATEVKAGAWKTSGLYASAPGGAVAVSSSSSRPAGASPTAAESGSAESGTAASGPAQQRQPSAPTLAPLTRAQLGLSARLVDYTGPGWSLRRPETWTPSEGDPNSSGGASTITLAPPGASNSSAGIGYGVLVGTVSADATGISAGRSPDLDAFAAASDALAQRLLKQDATLAQVGGITPLRAGGQPAYSIRLRGISPVTASTGAAVAQPERDQLVTVLLPDGGITYLIFVAPERDFPTLQPLFNNMLTSFRIR